MAFELPALPNFNTTLPQSIASMPNPMEQYGKMLQLRALSGNIEQQQQMQPLQVEQEKQAVQASTLENQQRQQQLDSQKELQKAIAGGVFNKFAGVETPDGSGFDAAGAFAELMKNHPAVLPQQASEAIQGLQKIGMNMADQRKTNAQAAEANAAVRSKTLDSIAAKVGSIGDMPATKATEALAAFKHDLVANPQAYPGMTKQELAELYGADLEHLPGISSLIGLEGKIADFHKSKAEATAAQQKVIPEGGGLSPDMQQQVQKDVSVATNPQVQQGKVNVATAEGQARQLVEGMEKPVYAIDPRTGQKVLMSATDALKGGARTMLPVTAKEVGDDTQLINRLGDVHQKIAEYEQNLANLGTSVSAKDQGNIAALIGKGSIKLGAFGTELSTDRLNAALQRENISGLSDDGKKLLVSYYNARESMQGYQRVLSGTGRANEKAMELNLDALPNPGTADKAYAQESLNQFKQNLQIVGQGLPKIPGIQSPEEIGARVNSPSSQLQVGQQKMIRGKMMTITAVHPDGSFDAK